MKILPRGKQKFRLTRYKGRKKNTHHFKNTTSHPQNFYTMALTTSRPSKPTEAREVDFYPGVAEDVADDEKTTACKVKADVRELNNNPRNTDIDMP